MTSSNHSGSARKLAAILSADVAGYARLMEADEEVTFARLGHVREILMRRIGQHGGRVANTAGDAVLAEFASAVESVRCAIATQEEIAAANSAVPMDRRVDFRIGLHVGDVITRDGDLFGDSVNIAARLQSMAAPGGITLSASSYDHVKKTVPIPYIDLGLQQFKNISESIRAYSIECLTKPIQVNAPGDREVLPLPPEPSIAVLPFLNLSGDGDPDYFSEGITDDIITALGRCKWFFVIASNSSFAYRGRTVDVRRIGQELGVRYVLEGSVRKAGDKLRITGQLIEAKNGRQIWAERFEGSSQDVFNLQDEIVGKVVGAIEPNLHAAEIYRAKNKIDTNVSCYDLFLQAAPYCLFETTPEQNRKAIELLRRAISLDPSFLRVRGALISSYLYLIHAQMFTQDDELALREDIRIVLEAGADDPDTIAYAGLALAILNNLDDGIELTDKAAELNPNIRALVCSALVSIYRGAPELAIDRFQRAMRLSPHSAISKQAVANIGLAYILMRRFDDALTWGRRAMRESPLNPIGRRLVISSLANLGRIDEARAEAAKLMAIMPHFRVSTTRKYAMGKADERVGSPYLNGLLAAGLPE